MSKWAAMPKHKPPSKACMAKTLAAVTSWSTKPVQWSHVLPVPAATAAVVVVATVVVAAVAATVVAAAVAAAVVVTAAAAVVAAATKPLPCLQA